MVDLEQLKENARHLAKDSQDLYNQLGALNLQQQQAAGVDPFVFAITVFVLACFVGYYVVWKVTPALHTPLMSVTNAISGVIILGAIIAVGPVMSSGFSTGVGFIAVVLASVNIFGGFVVTQRMLQMFKKKETKKIAEGQQ